MLQAEQAKAAHALQAQKWAVRWAVGQPAPESGDVRKMKYLACQPAVRDF